jgi:hypothetical protein
MPLVASGASITLSRFHGAGGRAAAAHSRHRPELDLTTGVPHSVHGGAAR